MKQPILLLAACCIGLSAAVAADKVGPAPNGITLPEGYKDWRVISISHRTDNKTLRVILGNDVAIAAAREGKINPWPNGAILGKVVWKDATDKHWAAATVPGALVHAEFMHKDSVKYASTGGWGYARWLGLEQKPYAKGGANFAQECVACHTPVKGQDWVYTRPARFP